MKRPRDYEERESPTAQRAEPALGAARHASVDVVRGATGLFMVFGWHLSTLPSAPAIWKHLHPPNGEGMTIADAVFPAFLFIVGLAIPLAEAAARAKGASTSALVRRIARRVATLLFVGVLFVNAQDEATGWPKRAWAALALASVLCAWHRAPSAGERARRVALALRAAGLLGLGVALVAYRHADGGWLRPGWWGILGIIGWTYGLGALVSLAARGRRALLVGAVALCLGLYAWTRALGREGWPSLWGWLDLGGVFGTHGAVVLVGVLIGSLLAGPTRIERPARQLAWAAVVVVGALAVAVALQPHFGVNKLRATPSWGLYSAAAAGVVWLAAAWAIDVRGWRRWAEPLRPVGENPLFAYLAYQLVVDLLLLSGRTELFTLGHLGPVWAVLTSLGFAGGILVLTTLARRFGPWPRL
ncbi:MAG: DUF5009 domain-containing protein [Planctomycetota bacterium]